MKAERDIAGITLPFAAGVLTAAYAGFFCTGNLTESSVIVTALIAAGTMLLLHPSRQHLSDFTVRAIIAAVMICCGMAAGLYGHITDSCHGIGGGLHPGPFIRLGNLMQAATDALPFAREETSAIIKALLTGERSDISPEVVAAFRSSGASHILALSGLHLGIIYGIIGRILSLAGNSTAARTSRSAATILICGIYTLATGAGASITRAFIFILLGETARLTGRFGSLRTILMSSLLIHLTISPQSVREAGFQLSYAAMAGIAFIFPHLKAFWPENEDSPGKKGGPLKWIWTSAALSISCQITTGPLAYIYFGTFPTHFLLTNLIALPLSGLIIPAALLTLLLHSCGICPEILLRATEALVTALSEALSIISSI